MYESRKQAPLADARFAWRLLGHLLVASGLLAASLVIGMLGYRAYKGLAWVDAFLNAAMLLGGMGPVYSPQTDAGKVFADSMRSTPGWCSSSPRRCCSRRSCIA